MIKEFLIALACFECLCEDNLTNYNQLDFLDTKRLNPYYWKLKQLESKSLVELSK